ncbi:MAG: VWA domain-containing protein [Raineya sp.]|nr:VWA domain-containing protein [Raineya sp.]
MEKSTFVFPHSPAWILVCVLAGALYAGILYFRENFFEIKIRYALAILRFLAVSIIAFLLLAPVIRTIRNDREKPIVAFALDNSLSIALVQDSLQRQKWLTELQKIQKKLENEGFETSLHTLNNGADWQTLQFKAQSTNLSKLIENITTAYENRNLDKVVLISDGIHNQGTSPEFLNYRFPVYTVGVGDTTPRKDIAVQAVFFNKIAYLGNKFPIVAEIKNSGFEERNVAVSLLQNGNTIASQNVRLRKENISEVDFLVQANQKGIQRYTIAVEFLEGEYNRTNNQRDALVEVIDGKEKILLLTTSPHPDIKALRSIIEKNENYTFEVVVAGVQQPKEANYDLIIAYQVPDYTGAFNTLLENFQKKGTPIFYILGANSDLNKFSQTNSVLNLRGRSADVDEIFPHFNATFAKFNFDSEKLRLLAKMPPLQVPYGEYSLKAGSEVLLYQMVGRLQTQKPLLALQMNKQNKSAVLAGEGLWQWRLAEYELTDRNDIVDEIILKVVQFLSSKEDKRKFRIYTTQNEYLDYETVVFEAEAYNELYEKISDVKVSLSLQDEKGKNYNYTFTITGGITKFEINNLPKGIYKYTATADVLGKTEKASGEFVIKDLQLETITTTADFDLLRKVAQNSQGKFFKINELESLQKEILQTKKPDLLHSSEELLEIIHLKWLFFAILGLLTAEWFVRKFLGSY